MKLMQYFIVFLFSVTAIAQGASNKARALLDEVYEKVKSYENIFIDFKYTLHNQKENIHQETRGDVTLNGEQYLFNYMGVTKLFDGKKNYTIVPENQEVVIENKDAEEPGTITPSKMLTFYRNGYRYEWDTSQNLRGRTIQYVKLIPIDSRSEVKQILLGIDAQTKHIYNLVEVGKNNTETTITVTTFKTNQPLSKTLFTFDEKKYTKEGYYIIRN